MFSFYFTYFFLQAYVFTQLDGTALQPKYCLLPLPSQVQMQALKCFSVLAYENTQVSLTLVNGEETSACLFSALSYSC